MTEYCAMCGLRNAASLRHVGCARHLGYPDACEVRIRDTQIDGLLKLLDAYRKLAEAADAMRLQWPETPASEAYDTARATVANLDRSTPSQTEQEAAAGTGRTLKE